MQEAEIMTQREAVMVAALYRRERDLKTKTVEERNDAIVLLVNENVELRRELTAPTTQRPGYQNGMRGLEEMDALANYPTR